MSVCSGCGREIDLCAFCEREDCRESICFRCMLFELGHAAASPHEQEEND